VYWRMWLRPENRCLVPANSFAEYAPEPNPETKKKDIVWFALNEDRPLFAFAGGDEVLRMFVTGGPPVRGGGGMPHRIIVISVPPSVLRITGAG
jgi:hypothetical protein